MAILGIDEVGRGPLAGPLVVGAVILPEVRPEWVEELRDSKKLSVKKRERLADLVLNEATAGLGWVMADELDAVGISEALRLATRRAVEEVQKKKVAFSQIVIDGKVNFLKDTALSGYVSTKVKADDLIKEVSAASVVAKRARDHYMYKLAERFPEYGFEKHVGYGTAKHLAAIREFGICPKHRKSFEPIKSMVGFDRDLDGMMDVTGVSGGVNVVKNTTLVGERGETAVCEYLMRLGHEIVMRNFKTRMCEIDIVSVCDGKIYFTEVKYRKSDVRGGGLLAITPEKIKRMKFAAEVFLKYYKRYQVYDPLLAVAEVSGEDFVVREWMPLS